MSNEEEFTAAGAGKLLGISRDTVVRLIHQGKLRARNVSAGPFRPRYRIPLSAIEEYRATTWVNPPAAPQVAYQRDWAGEVRQRNRSSRPRTRRRRGNS